MAQIRAIVTLNRGQPGGGAPIFQVKTIEELQDTAFLLEKILDASAHDLKNGTVILVER
ncbi:capping complex subunit for YIEGIA [Paenibacillus sp. 1P07SE]|uniref:capping complex subunit for YIEGIA n=1 Tax=Paenibacillus sp. 1P07SE TaxID=3132209 RepID=UPI0039A595ED